MAQYRDLNPGADWHPRPAAPEYNKTVALTGAAQSVDFETVGANTTKVRRIDLRLAPDSAATSYDTDIAITETAGDHLTMYEADYIRIDVPDGLRWLYFKGASGSIIIEAW